MGQLVTKGFCGDLLSSQRGEMRCVHLAVDQAEALSGQKTAQMCKGNFGGVCAAAEHGFAKEDPAQGNSVQSSDQFVVLPGFDAMRPSEFVQLVVGGLHVGTDPGAVLS